MTLREYCAQFLKEFPPKDGETQVEFLFRCITWMLNMHVVTYDYNGMEASQCGVSSEQLGHCPQLIGPQSYHNACLQGCAAKAGRPGNQGDTIACPNGEAFREHVRKANKA